MMSAELAITNPAIEAATPDSELSSEMTTGMSAPPMGSTASTPSTDATATTSQ